MNNLLQLANNLVDLLPHLSCKASNSSTIWAQFRSSKASTTTPIINRLGSSSRASEGCLSHLTASSPSSNTSSTEYL